MGLQENEQFRWHGVGIGEVFAGRCVSVLFFQVEFFEEPNNFLALIISPRYINFILVTVDPLVGWTKPILISTLCPLP